MRWLCGCSWVHFRRGCDIDRLSRAFEAGLGSQKWTSMNTTNVPSNGSPITGEQVCFALRAGITIGTFCRWRNLRLDKRWGSSSGAKRFRLYRSFVLPEVIRSSSMPLLLASLNLSLHYLQSRQRSRNHERSERSRECPSTFGWNHKSHRASFVSSGDVRA